MLALINGIIITPNELIKNSAVVIDDNLIADIIPIKQLPQEIDTYDCKKRYIMPGLIDTHCDCIENQIVPRKGIIFDFESALIQLDKQLLGNGITTMYHSISIANSTIVNKIRTLSVEHQLKIGEMIHSIKDSLIISHKFHARLEMNTIEAVDTIMRLINDKGIDELSFMDHTPGQGQYRDLSMFKVEIEKQYGLLNETKKQQIISQCSSKDKISKQQMSSIIEQCHSNHIPLAYHDVDSIELVNWMKENGFKICEFPITKEAAFQANKLNFFNIVGAPNILHGQSHNGNLSAFELLSSGVANIICSDYYVVSMLPAIFMLFQKGIPLQQAVKFGTYNPAIAMDLNDRGAIDIGKKADIIIVNYDNKIPIVTESFINGSLRYKVEI